MVAHSDEEGFARGFVPRGYIRTKVFLHVEAPGREHDRRVAVSVEVGLG